MRVNMSENSVSGPLRPGDRAPDVELDAIAHDGKIALHDFRGRSPVLIGLFRGLHCPFCRRHIAAMARLDGALREKGVESIAVVNTPVERARLYFRFHPLPNMIAASDSERVSHRAFGLPNLLFTENETEWPYKVGMNVAATMRVDMPGELPGPMDPDSAAHFLNEKDGYAMTEADMRMAAMSKAQLIGEFLVDRDGIVRWSFTEADEGGKNMFRAPNPDEVISAASGVLH
jgi:peroxiredoxin